MISNEVDQEEELEALRIENKVQAAMIKNMRKEYMAALKYAPNYLCNDCKMRWREVRDRQKEFIRRIT